MKRFGLAIKLAHAVNAISFLKHFWKESPVIGSATFQTTTNKIMKRNYAHALETGLTNAVTLVPDVGFTITADDITLTNNGITVEVAPVCFVDLIDTIVEKSFYLTAVVFLSTRLIDEYPEYYFLHLVSPKVTLNLTNPVTFTIPLSSMDTKYFDAYSEKKAFFSLITATADDVPVHYSDTVCNV